MIAKILDDKTIHVFDKTQFDWYAIRNSGQIFRDPPCTITQSHNKITIKATADKDSKWLWNFFDLDTDYNEIKNDLAQFTCLGEPIRAGQGIRILRQPFCETVLSFIISANNNIKRFTKTIEKIDFNNLDRYTEKDFHDFGCGYRAPYLVKTVRQLKEINSHDLAALDNAALRKQLLTLSGVGPKVADCIMLFAFHRLDITPVDTWIEKAIDQLGTSAKEILNHKYAGIAQQYIFYYLQHLRKTID